MKAQKEYKPNLFVLSRADMIVYKEIRAHTCSPAQTKFLSSALGRGDPKGVSTSIRCQQRPLSRAPLPSEELKGVELNGLGPTIAG